MRHEPIRFRKSPAERQSRDEAILEELSVQDAALTYLRSTQWLAVQAERSGRPLDAVTQRLRDLALVELADVQAIRTLKRRGDAAPPKRK
jgi:hypothetical protein